MWPGGRTSALADPKPPVSFLHASSCAASPRLLNLTCHRRCWRAPQRIRQPGRAAVRASTSSGVGRSSSGSTAYASASGISASGKNCSLQPGQRTDLPGIRAFLGFSFAWQCGQMTEVFMIHFPWQRAQRFWPRRKYRLVRLSITASLSPAPRIPPPTPSPRP